MYWLTAGIIPMLIYGASRYHERRVLKRPLELSKLDTLPLPVLFLRLFYIERSRLRLLRKAVDLPAWEKFRRAKADYRRLRLILTSGINPTRSGRGNRLEQVAMRVMRMTNNVVGSDAACPLDERADYANHITAVLDGLAPLGTLSTMVSIPEDNLLVYLVRMCNRIGIDGQNLLSLAWQNYLPNALRVLDHEPTTTQAVLDQAEQGYIYLHTLVGLLLGLDRDTADLMAKLDVTNLCVHDRLLDGADDARKGVFQFSSAEFAEHGIDPASLNMGPEIRRIDLALIPGFSQWMMDLATMHGELWRTDLLPQLLERVLPHIRPKSVRNYMERNWVERGKSFAAMQDWWSRHITIVPYARFEGDTFTPELYDRMMIGNPPFAEILADIARTFGVPVSPDDMERWRRGDAFAHYADVVLDTWTDRDAAWRVYEQLLFDPWSMDCPSPEFQIAIDSAIMLHNSLAGLPTMCDVQRTALAAGRSAGEKSAADNIFRYAQAILTEDRRSAAIFAFMMSKEAQAHSGFPGFVKFFTLLTIIIGVYDHKVDFVEDFEADRVAFRSRLHRRGVLQVVFLWHSLRVLAQIGPVTKLGATVAAYVVGRYYPNRKEVTNQ
jgi:hypothetical protein